MAGCHRECHSQRMNDLMQQVQTINMMFPAVACRSYSKLATLLQANHSLYLFDADRKSVV